MTWFVLPFQVGLWYNEEANDPGAQTERRGEAGPVSVLLRGWDSPAAFFVVRSSGRTVLQTVLLNRTVCKTVLLLFHAQHLLCVRPKAAQFLILGIVLLHPFDGLVVPFAGVFFLAQLP